MISAVELEILRTDLPGIVRNFRQNSPQSWQFSCDICGDSRKDRRKARFGINVKDGGLVCHCFNCDWSGSFLTYLRYQHPDLAQRVSRENFVTQQTSTLYDLSRLVSEADSEILSQLFYINKYSDTQKWVNKLESLKIKLNRDAFRKLYNVHNRIHNEQQP